MMDVRNTACDLLLEHRIKNKTATSDPKMKEIEDRLFVAEPMKRDNRVRDTVNPKTLDTPQTRDILKRNMHDVEEENGGAGVFNFDKRLHWKLENDEWTHDPIPEFYNGKNVMDFYHENIEKDMEELEREERRLLIREIQTEPERERGKMLAILSADDTLLHRYITRKMYFARKDGAVEAKTRSARPRMTRTQKKMPLSELKEKLGDLGIDTTNVEKTTGTEDRRRKKSIDRRRSRGRSRTRDSANANRKMKVKNGEDVQRIARTQSRSRSRAEKADPYHRSLVRSRSRSRAPSKGISSMRASRKADHLMHMAMKGMRKASTRIHESDRRVDTKKPVRLLVFLHFAHFGCVSSMLLLVNVDRFTCSKEKTDIAPEDRLCVTAIVLFSKSVNSTLCVVQQILRAH